VNELEKTSVRAPTVVSWVAGLLSLVGLVAWGGIANRLERLENGTGIPMAETTKQRFEQLDGARARIEYQFDRHDDRLDALEQRVRALEAIKGTANVTLLESNTGAALR
jgi:uncharacterized membrane-anchored protein YhcB (DUF1043 family)